MFDDNRFKVTALMVKKPKCEEGMPCLVCGGVSGWKHVVSLPFLLFRRNAQIVKCLDCGVGRTFPAPDISVNYYVNNDRNDVLFTERAVIYRYFAEELLSNLMKVSDTTGSLLDFGCGGGFIVEAASRLGYQAEGVEANLAMVHWCQSRGLRVHQKEIAQLVEEGRKYDVIVFSAVLEHLSDPYSVLVACKQLLVPSGIIVISQASYDGLLPRLFPWGWYGWRPLEHFWHFTPYSSTLMCARCDMYPAHLIRGNLHHPWFRQGTFLELIGRNFAALIARIGLRIGKGDSFYLFVK